MTDEVIIAAVGEYSDGLTIRKIGVSNRAYHDPALASQIDSGVFFPIIDPSADLSWYESIRFQPQGGSTSVQVSDLPIINAESDFDDWSRFTVSGLRWTLKRGRPDQSWDEFETIFDAVGAGAPEFQGRTRMTIKLRDRFAPLERPVSQTVFDIDVPNERYINRLRPLVFGDVFQVNADVVDPFFFRVFAAENLAVIRRVAEGGRPTTNWTDVEFGYQINQSSFGNTLQITSDIGGPPKPDTELRDLLADIGGFNAWTADNPDGWTIVETPPDSEIEEDAVNGGALIKSTLGTSTGGDDLSASIAARTPSGIGSTLTGVDASGDPVPDLANWPALIDADDAAKVVATVGGASRASPRLTLTGFGAAIGASAAITGFTVGIRAQKGGAGTGAIRFSEVRLLLPNGSVTADKSASRAVSGTKTLEEFGGALDTWGLTPTPGLVNTEGLGIRLAFTTAATGSFPVTAEIFEVILTIHTGDGGETLKLYVDLSMVQGDRYRIRIEHDDLAADPSETISAKWAGVETTSSPIPDLVRVPGSTGAIGDESLNLGDPNVLTTGEIVGTGVLEGEFIADAAVLGIEFFSKSGQSGTQRITRIGLDEISISINRYQDLVRALAADAGFDVEIDIDNDNFAAIAVATGNPPLGWYVRNQTSRDQLITLFSHSLASASWGGIDGKLHAAMLVLPSQPKGEFLRIGPERNMGESISVQDEAGDLRDRVVAAQNVDPIREAETAGITETWPETERQKVIADWRITERADFDQIAAGTIWPIIPAP